MNLLHIWHFAYLSEYLHECLRIVKGARIFFFALLFFVIRGPAHVAGSEKAYLLSRLLLGDLDDPASRTH